MDERNRAQQDEPQPQQLALSISPSGTSLIGQATGVVQAGESVQYWYTIQANKVVYFQFEAAGHYVLTPSYVPGPSGAATGADDQDNEGSARDHGETIQSVTRLAHPSGDERTVTWTIDCVDPGDGGGRYTVKIWQD